MAVIQNNRPELNPDRSTYLIIDRGTEGFFGYWMDPSTGGLPMGQGLVGDLKLVYEVNQTEGNIAIGAVAYGRSDRQVGTGGWQNELWGAYGVPVFAPEPGNGVGNPVKVAKDGVKEAERKLYDTVIVDTAGRLHIDDQLMEEMQSLKRLLNPQEILFIADAMTGQDAVKSADEFHKKLALTGVVLTKMDGDARGGAALSIRQVTGQPIKFIGVGEKYDALEPFHPDRIVSRILGMGDILSLIEKAEQNVDKKKAHEMASRALSGDGFSLEDFRDQLRQIKKMGSIQNLMGMLPSVGPFAGIQKHADKVDEKQLNRVEAIINSMTQHERMHHEVMNGSRRKRIARGSGTSVQEVNNLLRQYAQMRKMFKQIGKPSFARKLAGMKMPGM